MNWELFILVYFMISFLYIMISTEVLDGKMNFKILTTKKYWNRVKWDFLVGIASCLIFVSFSQDNPYVIFGFFFNLIFIVIWFLIFRSRYDIKNISEKVNDINMFIMLLFFGFLIIPYLHFHKKKDEEIN